MAIDWDWRPDFGSLTWEFSFDPLHYGVGGDRRREFVTMVQNDLKSFGFVLNNEVRVQWELYVDEQERLETPAGADVDNFAKLMNDAIKGPSGLLIDDSQIQRLEVAWISLPGVSGFKLVIECHQDNVTSKPLRLYEMPDGMWYPMTNLGDALDAPQVAMCSALAQRVLTYRRVRHHLRSRGATKAMAYEYSAPIKAIAMGFHKTRVADSDFVLVGLSEWQEGQAKMSKADRRKYIRSKDEIESQAIELAAALMPRSR